jgi:hypothetical protein
VAAHGPNSVGSALPGELAEADDSGVGWMEPDRIRAHTMFFPISEWFGSFVLTLAVEAPIVWFAFRNAEIGLPRLAVLFFFANLATHLAVWYVWTQLFEISTLQYVVASEAWAVAAEALFYGAAVRGISAARATVVAVAANLTSAAVGVVMTTPWPDVIA